MRQKKDKQRNDQKKEQEVVEIHATHTKLVLLLLYGTARIGLEFAHCCKRPTDETCAPNRQGTVGNDEGVDGYHDQKGRNPTNEDCANRTFDSIVCEKLRKVRMQIPSVD